jgi:hypothetical protein
MGKLRVEDAHHFFPNFEGYATMQLVEALRYKPKGRVFNPRRGYWNFDVILPAALWP